MAVCAYQVLGRQSSSIGMARIISEIMLLYCQNLLLLICSSNNTYTTTVMLQMVFGGFREENTNEILVVCDIIFQIGDV